MGIFKFLLYPLALIYGLITWIRNKLYDWGVLKSHRFGFPVISVGNLSVGGTGKTPHVEYLIRLLKDDFKVASISRGYRRKTKGYLETGLSSTSEEVGDESVQKKQKFPDVVIAVDEKRVKGIKRMMNDHPDTDVIILDDAFQHRQVRPGLNILLTDFHRLYCEDYPLPMGKLREFRKGAARADVIVVTKTYSVLSPLTRRRITRLINPRDHQKLYFSYIKFGALTPVPGMKSKLHPPEKINAVLLFAGIANMYHLIEHTKKMATTVEVMRFKDHHVYSEADMAKIREAFDNIFAKNKIIITTEKDAMRLFFPECPEIFKGLPVFYIPIEVVFHKEFRGEFNHQILAYVQANSGNG